LVGITFEGISLMFTCNRQMVPLADCD